VISNGKIFPSGKRSNMTPTEKSNIEAEVVSLIPALRAFARRFVANKNDADDLVQETLMKVLANTEKFTPGTRLKSWMFTILRNTFYTRSYIARREGPAKRADVVDRRFVEPNQELCMELEELRRAVERLPENQRAVVIAIALNGDDYESVSVKTGCAVGTIKSRLNRARAALHADLEGNLGPQHQNNEH
jgi:RNA polymerase sigma factor (sigma-70 family)